MARKLLAAWLLAVSTSVSAAQDDPSIRVKVDAVNVLVTVTDQKGRFVTDISRERFQVYEDGKLQQLTNFSHQTDLPLHIGLLMDTSASVRTKLDFEKRAATQFIRSVIRSRDQMLLVEFDSGVNLIRDFTRRASTVARQIQGLRAGGGTALLDAIYTVTRDKMTSPAVRQTIVVLSDGADVDSKRTAEETLRLMQTSGVTLYAIGTNRFGAGGDRRGEKVLKKLAEETGGRAFFPFSEQQFTAAFETIDEELRSQYSLTYVPATPLREGEFRKLKVKIVKGKNLELRYRQGYYVSGS